MTIREMIENLEKMAKEYGEDVKVGFWGDEGLDTIKEMYFAKKGTFFGDTKQDMIVLIEE